MQPVCAAILLPVPGRLLNTGELGAECGPKIDFI